jgi:HlyD family secretion protein
VSTEGDVSRIEEPVAPRADRRAESPGRTHAARILRARHGGSEPRAHAAVPGPGVGEEARLSALPELPLGGVMRAMSPERPVQREQRIILVGEDARPLGQRGSARDRIDAVALRLDAQDGAPFAVAPDLLAREGDVVEMCLGLDVEQAGRRSLRRALDHELHGLEVVVVADVGDAKRGRPIARVEEHVSEVGVRPREDGGAVHRGLEPLTEEREVLPVVGGPIVAVEVDADRRIGFGRARALFLREGRREVPQELVRLARHLRVPVREGHLSADLGREGNVLGVAGEPQQRPTGEEREPGERCAEALDPAQDFSKPARQGVPELCRAPSARNNAARDGLLWGVQARAARLTPSAPRARVPCVTTGPRGHVACFVLSHARMSQAEHADHRLVLPGGVKRSAFWARPLYVALLLAVVVALAVWLYTRAREPTDTAIYRTVPVERRNIARVVEAMGRVDVEERFEVPVPQAGAVRELFVEAGARVKEGQPLATLDPTEAELKTREAFAGVEAARRRLELARTELETASARRIQLEKLFADRFAKRADLESARAAEQRAAASLRVAEAESRVSEQKGAAARENVALLTIRAPADGIVLDAPRWVGTPVAPEKGPLFVIGRSLDKVQVEVSVPEADVGAVKKGQSVEFTVPAFPGRKFSGVVSHVGVDSTKSGSIVVYPVWLSAENPEHALRAGMSANVRISVAHVENALAVRDAALRFTPEEETSRPRSRIYVSPDGVNLAAVDVELGLSDGSYTEIVAAKGQKLEPGAAVVVGLLHPERAGGSGGPGISLGKK